MKEEAVHELMTQGSDRRTSGLTALRSQGDGI